MMAGGGQPAGEVSGQPAPPELHSDRPETIEQALAAESHPSEPPVPHESSSSSPAPVIPQTDTRSEAPQGTAPSGPDRSEDDQQ